GVGSQTIPQLNLGTVGILVQSLAELGNGKEPVLMQLRPTDPLTFDIGAGTTASPNLTLHLKNLEVDFYALIYERYVRAFTLGVTTDIGVNVMFSIDASGKPVITLMLVGLSSTNIRVKVTNSEFLRESAAQLEAVFPT